MQGATLSDLEKFLSKQEIRNLYRIDRAAILRATVGTWALIAASLWVWSATGHWAVFGLAFFIIGTRQHALNNLVHEAAHFSISRNKTLNDWISDVLYAAPHLISTDGYRSKHKFHHSALGDPHLDTETKPRYVVKGWGFAKHTVLAFIGYEAYLAARTYVPEPERTKGIQLKHAILVAITNSAIFAYCWVVGAPFAYFFLWLLPLFTLTIYISMLRVLAEHQPVEYAQDGIVNRDLPMPQFTRTITAGMLERFIFGPLNFCYHREHHMIPGIPFANLPRLHRLLRERGFYIDGDDGVAETYLGTLYNLVVPPSPSPLPQTGVSATP
jgi:fatty acid desaturase